MEKLCSCHIKYAESFLSKTYNKFWKDVLQAFININKNINLKDDMVWQTPLFYDINIKIGGSHIFYKTWFDKGIRFLNDLIHENGELYSHEKFQENTGINSNTLQYQGTIKSVKEYLKTIKVNITHKINNPFIPSQILPFIKEKKGSKTMYDILNQNKDIPTGQLTWNKLYTFTAEDWFSYLHLPLYHHKIPSTSLVPN